MLTLRGTVFDAPVMGTVTVYSDPTFDGALATADKLLIQATTAQAAGNPCKLTIDLERSN